TSPRRGSAPIPRPCLRARSKLVVHRCSWDLRGLQVPQMSPERRLVHWPYGQVEPGVAGAPQPWVLAKRARADCSTRAPKTGTGNPAKGTDPGPDREKAARHGQARRAELSGSCQGASVANAAAPKAAPTAHHIRP